METAAPRNLLLENVEYRVEETARGVWRKYLYPDGSLFKEFKSHAEFAGMPLIHYTYGICPETGERITAQGFIAVGRVARGVLAIGQAAYGVVAIGQLAIGLVIGIGQLSTGVFAFGQLAIGLLMGIGQFSLGLIAVGQGAYGYYVLAQAGEGAHVIDSRGVDPIAERFFLQLIGR